MLKLYNYFKLNVNILMSRHLPFKFKLEYIQWIRW